MLRFNPTLVAIAASWLIGAALAPIALAKSVFDADPAHQGLLIADLRLRHKTLIKWEEARLERGAAVRLDVAAPAVAAGEEVSKTLVFAVEPGQWRLGAALASLQLGPSLLSFEVRFPSDSLPELTQWVKAGEVVYVGRIESRSLPSLRKGPQVHSTVSFDRARAIDVLKRLGAKARKSAWAGPLTARAAALESGTPEPGAAPADTKAAAPADTTTAPAGTTTGAPPDTTTGAPADTTRH